MVRVLAKHVGATGMASVKYAAWNRITNPANKTWKKAKDYFRDALEDAEDIMAVTAAESGLSANSVLSTNQDVTREIIHQEINQQLAGHLDNLALAATERRQDVSSLTASVDRLSKQVEELTKTNGRLTLQLEQANNRIRNLENNNGGGGRNGGGARGGGRYNQNQNQTNTGADRPGSHTRIIPLGKGIKVKWPKVGEPWPTETDITAYCWSCGYCLVPGHNSATCSRAKENPSHKKTATRSNPMGGSLRNAGWGEAPNGMERM